MIQCTTLPEAYEVSGSVWGLFNLREENLSPVLKSGMEKTNSDTPIMSTPDSNLSHGCFLCSTSEEREEFRVQWREEEDLTIHSVRNSDAMAILHRQLAAYNGIKYETLMVCHYMVGVLFSFTFVTKSLKIYQITSAFLLPKKIF